MLTELQVRSARPRERDYKLYDRRGLYLLVKPSGYRSWRWKYSFAGRAKTMVFGVWPAIGLKKARELREDAGRTLDAGRDPGAEKRRRRPSSAAGDDSLESLARRWHARQLGLWSKKHAADVLKSLEDEVFPQLGTRPVGEVTTAELLERLEAVQDRGAIETAHRLRGRLSEIFGMAIAAGLVAADPAAPVAALLKPIRKRKRPALVRLAAAQAVLREVEAQPGQPLTRLASRLLALTAARPGMIRFAAPAEFEDLDGREPLWRVPAEKMKLLVEEKEQEAFEFLVPLARQSVDVVRAALRIVKGGPWLFPSIRDAHRPMSENALNVAYRRSASAHGRHVPHGWRSTFSSIMNERAVDRDRPGDHDVVELMLAHRLPGVRGIYNRAAYMKRRRQIAQEWADLLLKGFPPAAQLLEGPRR